MFTINLSCNDINLQVPSLEGYLGEDIAMEGVTSMITRKMHKIAEWFKSIINFIKGNLLIFLEKNLHAQLTVDSNVKKAVDNGLPRMRKIADSAVGVFQSAVILLSQKASPTVKKRAEEIYEKSRELSGDSTDLYSEYAENLKKSGSKEVLKTSDITNYATSAKALLSMVERVSNETDKLIRSLYKGDAPNTEIQSGDRTTDLMNEKALKLAQGSMMMLSMTIEKYLKMLTSLFGGRSLLVGSKNEINEMEE